MSANFLLEVSMFLTPLAQARENLEIRQYFIRLRTIAALWYFTFWDLKNN